MNYRCSLDSLGCSLHHRAKPWIQGLRPQKQTLHVHIAAGVFSETLDYRRRPNIRPDISYVRYVTFLSSELTAFTGLRSEGNRNDVGDYDKDAAQLPEVVWGGADAEK